MNKVSRLELAAGRVEVFNIQREAAWWLFEHHALISVCKVNEQPAVSVHGVSLKASQTPREAAFFSAVAAQ